jgi:hypothetical protein
MSTTTQGEQMAPEMRPAQNNQAATAIPKYSVVKRVPAEAPDGVVVTAAATDVPAGVVPKRLEQAGGLNGIMDVGDMVIRGRTRVIASAAITANDRISPAAAGKVQTAVATNVVMGVALETCTTDGDIIMAEIDCTAPVVL